MAMASSTSGTSVSLVQILQRNDVPEPLITYLTTTCGNTTIEMFLDMVVKKEYEAELRDLIKAKFPVGKDFSDDQQRW